MTRVQRIAQRDGWVCHYCRPVIPGVPVRPLTAKTATADHVIPASQGGSNGLGNLVLACDFHNRFRGTMEYPKYREKLNLPPCPEVWLRAKAVPSSPAAPGTTGREKAAWHWPWEGVKKL